MREWSKEKVWAALIVLMNGAITRAGQTFGVV